MIAYNRAIMKNVIVRVPDELHKKLRLLALEQNTSLQQIAIDLFQEFVGKQEKKIKKK